MTREQLYLELKQKINTEPDRFISGYFNILNDYDELQFNENPDWIPLANNANREELCEAYTEEDIKTMVDVILKSLSNNKKIEDKVLERELIASYKLSIAKRRQRSDNRNYIVKQYLLDKEKIITNLLLHKDIIYNPIVINIGGISVCESILKLDLGFISRHKFLEPVMFPSGKNLKTCLVNIDKLKELGYPQIIREDILDIDLRHYTATIRTLIQNNKFDVLKLKS